MQGDSAGWRSCRVHAKVVNHTRYELHEVLDSTGKSNGKWEGY